MHDLEPKNASVPRFVGTHVLFYFGGLITLSSLTWFLVDQWERLGGAGIFAVAAIYGASFLAAGRHLWKDPATRIPAGIFVTTAVWMTPLAIYGIERAIGWWPSVDPGKYSNYYSRIHGSWLLLEFATIVAGGFALRAFRFPFITFPIAVAGWFLSMDVAPLLLGIDELTGDQQKGLSIAVGAIMLLFSFLADGKNSEDYSFWGYLFGLLAFWGGLSTLNSTSEVNRFIYCLINLAMIFTGVRLRRKVFLVFGAIGVFGYLAHLSHAVFRDAIAYPFVMSAVGIAIVGWGIHHQKTRTSRNE